MKSKFDKELMSEEQLQDIARIFWGKGVIERITEADEWDEFDEFAAQVRKGYAEAMYEMERGNYKINDLHQALQLQDQNIAHFLKKVKIGDNATIGDIYSGLQMKNLIHATYYLVPKLILLLAGLRKDVWLREETKGEITAKW